MRVLRQQHTTPRPPRLLNTNAKNPIPVKNNHTPTHHRPVKGPRRHRTHERRRTLLTNQSRRVSTPIIRPRQLTPRQNSNIRHRHHEIVTRYNTRHESINTRKANNIRLTSRRNPSHPHTINHRPINRPLQIKNYNITRISLLSLSPSNTNNNNPQTTRVPTNRRRHPITQHRRISINNLPPNITITSVNNGILTHTHRPPRINRRPRIRLHRHLTVSIKQNTIRHPRRPIKGKQKTQGNGRKATNNRARRQPQRSKATGT